MISISHGRISKKDVMCLSLIWMAGKIMGDEIRFFHR